MVREYTQEFIDRSIHEIAKEKVILDVGGGARFGKWMAPYKELFTHTTYKTFDYDASTGADVVGDIHSIPLTDESVDAIICSSVLEHVKNPSLAMSELKRILKKNGKIFFFVPSTYPYHARKGHYPDYWRFFEDTIHELFSGFSEVSIQKRGGYFMALSFFMPLQAKMRWILTPLAQILDRLFKTENKNTTAGYYVFARK